MGGLRARVVFAAAPMRQRKERPADDTELAGHVLYRISYIVDMIPSVVLVAALGYKEESFL